MRSAYCALRATRYRCAMPNYRRAFAPGGCWFFTVNLLDRRRRLLTDHIDALREATRRTQTRHPFMVDAMVVLPDRVRDWPHSSFHRDVQAELFPQDWAGDVSAKGSFGERV